MKDIMDLINVENLNEEDVKNLSEKINSVIDLKVQEKVQDKISIIKDTLVEEYEDKFETYKTEITEKFSNFVDEILDEELSIPEHILEYAKKGELYYDLIEQFKTRFIIDEGHIDDEVKGILREARDEITSLKSQLNSSIQESLDTELEMNRLKAKNIIMEKTSELPFDTATKVKAILEGETDPDRINQKIDSIIETITESKEIKETKVDEVVVTSVTEEVQTIKSTSNLMSLWEKALNKEAV